MDEDELKAELRRLNRIIPVHAAELDKLRERRDMLTALFPEKIEEPGRVVQKQFAIGA